MIDILNFFAVDGRRVVGLVVVISVVGYWITWIISAAKGKDFEF